MISCVDHSSTYTEKQYCIVWVSVMACVWYNVNGGIGVEWCVMLNSKSNSVNNESKVRWSKIKYTSKNKKK